MDLCGVRALRKAGGDARDRENRLDNGEEASGHGETAITGKPAELISSFTPRGPDPGNSIFMSDGLAVPAVPWDAFEDTGFLHDHTQPAPRAHRAAPHLMGSDLQDHTPAVNTAPERIILHLLSPCPQSRSWFPRQLCLAPALHGDIVQH